MLNGRWDGAGSRLGGISEFSGYRPANGPGRKEMQNQVVLPAARSPCRGLLQAWSLLGSQGRPGKFTGRKT